MALSPIKPRDNSVEELERFRRDCVSMNCTDKYQDILEPNTIELPKSQYDVSDKLEDSLKKKVRRKRTTRSED